jgi:hypothetical protein
MFFKKGVFMDALFFLRHAEGLPHEILDPADVERLNNFFSGRKEEFIKPIKIVVSAQARARLTGLIIAETLGTTEIEISNFFDPEAPSNPQLDFIEKKRKDSGTLIIIGHKDALDLFPIRFFERWGSFAFSSKIDLFEEISVANCCGFAINFRTGVLSAVTI